LLKIHIKNKITSTLDLNIDTLLILISKKFYIKFSKSYFLYNDVYSKAFIKCFLFYSYHYALIYYFNKSILSITLICIHLINYYISQIHHH